MRLERNRVYYAITPEGAYYCDEAGPVLPVTGPDLSTAHYQAPILTKSEEIVRRLEALRPTAHFRRIQVADLHKLDSIVRELRIGERHVDAQPLTQMARITQENTLPETTIHQEATILASMLEQYERAEIMQSQLLKKLMERHELANREGNHESTTFVMLLMMLVNHQLSFIFRITKREHEHE